MTASHTYRHHLSSMLSPADESPIGASGAAIGGLGFVAAALECA